MVLLAEPSLTDTRSMRADFLEMSALFSTRGRSGAAHLLGVLDLSSDTAIDEPVFDEADAELLDEDIVESKREQIVASTFEELIYRQTCLVGAYPFVIDARTQTLILRDLSDAVCPGRDVYLFCLLASGIRSDQLQGGPELKQLTYDIANTFQICACLAAGGFLSGDVSSFGFPRATGDAFLPALQNTFSRFGSGSVRAEIPDGLPEDLKDGGIDVIAWRDFPDLMPGKMYLLGQSASGANWRSKSVVEYIPQLHGAWFSEAPAKFTTPAMFIPFPLHHDLDEPRRDAFAIALRRRYWYEEQRFGIVFDRNRISHLAEICMGFEPHARQRIESADRFNNIRDWVNKMMILFRGN